MHTSHDSKPLSAPLLFLMAAAISATVATLYYNQPLLPAMRQTFGIDAKAMGLIPAAAQLGYAAAILFISPLGDTMNRRNLIGCLSLLSTGALLAAFASPNFGVLVAASFAIGLGANTVQQIIPLGASLTPQNLRGRTVGTLMTGMTVGILLSRTASGTVAENFGWRSVYLFAAVLSVLIGMALQLKLPKTKPAATMSYPALLASMFGLFKKHKLLREATLTGALWYAAFNVHWATLAIYVTGEPFSYTVQQAGMFGLIGLSGIIAANIAGRLVEAVGASRLIAVALAMITASFVVFAVWGTSLTGIIIGIILLDLGVFGAQIPNQVRVLSIAPEAQSRINAVYMLGYFVAAASGSLLGVWVVGLFGWTGVAVLGLGLSGFALVFHLSVVSRTSI